MFLLFKKLLILLSCFNINFKDAEGDLGLNPSDVDPPFNPVTFKRDNSGNLIVYSARPPEAPSFNPIDWVINPIINNATVRDTIWVEQNEDHNNIFVRFFIKRNGVFTEFRWQDPPFFTTFNGRFPRIINGDEALPVEGSIQYSIKLSRIRKKIPRQFHNHSVQCHT